jgi:1-acyl-sn-glycerol-3-phosphate acyltransferase
MLAVFSALYWTFFALTLPVFLAGAVLVFLVTVPFDRRRVLLHLYTCFWASFYVYLSPIWRCRVVGRDRLPWKGPAVIVANHLSLIDILVLHRLYRPFKWVSKSSNFRLPFLGWNMRLNGYVPITRGKADSVIWMMKRCRELLGEGCPLLFFPEGTRSESGELGPFKDGAFQLAIESGVPVFPVAVSGTHQTLPKHGIVLRNRMDGVVEVLEPIDPAAFETAAALQEAARTAIARALERR